MRVTFCLTTLAFVFLTRLAMAQQLAPTTVQLPTFSSFTVSTVVAVPDSGYGFAHGPRQVSHGWTAYGPAWGASTTHWEAVDHFHMWSVGVQTVDLAALDAELLAAAPLAPPIQAPLHPVARQFIAPQASSAAHVPGSVADARRARAAATDAEEAKIDQLVAKAEALLAEGQPNLARIYLQMAAGKSSGERRQELEARATALRGLPARPKR